MVKIKEYLGDRFRSLKKPTVVVKDEVPHVPARLQRRQRHLSGSVGGHSPTPDSDDVTIDLDRMRLDSPTTGYKECFACKTPVHEVISFVFCQIRDKITYNLFQYWDETYAMNKVWHMDCFNCAQCGKVLNPQKFCEKNGKAYCEHDYNQIFLPKCFSCTKTVFEVRALNIYFTNY
jgi:hypothetical protein